MENYTMEQLAEMVIEKDKKHRKAWEMLRIAEKENIKILDEFEKINNKTLTDFLPAEPIKIADMLINAEGEYENNQIMKAISGADKGTYSLFDISELRQIAEHLLVYCNANQEDQP